MLYKHPHHTCIVGHYALLRTNYESNLHYELKHSSLRTTSRSPPILPKKIIIKILNPHQFSIPKSTMAETKIPSPPFNLAIIGGGIAGCILSISLHKHNIPHTLYESASQFGEIGAGVGFEPNFVRTMELISPTIKEAFLRCAERVEYENPLWFTVRMGDCREAVLENGLLFRARDGKESKVGEKMFDWPSRPGAHRGGVHRAHLLDELVKLIPAHVPKFRKKLVDVKEADDGSGDAVLSFADGSVARHSAVIGCDGIKSTTRELVLGKEEARPVFSGKCAYRGLIPMEKAVEIMGDEEPRTAQMYCGYHGHVLTFPIARGSLMNGEYHSFVTAVLGLRPQSSHLHRERHGQTPSGLCRARKRICSPTLQRGALL
jgi:2-polyprenyl-6-methoxyphenol hydroxylase-like FAD-dependent oxidoreductase